MLIFNLLNNKRYLKSNTTFLIIGTMPNTLTMPRKLINCSILIALSFIFSYCSNAPATPTSSAALAQIQKKAEPQIDSAMRRVLDDYDRFFKAQMASTFTPGAAVVIVKGNEVIFCKAYGVKSGLSNDPVTENTVFRIGSLSKGFAGVLSGILVQDSVLHWHDPVQKYYPEFTLRDARQAKRVQMCHLLSHSTGLPYHAYTQLIEEGWDIRKIVKHYFPKAPVSGKEGEFFSYQNVAFCCVEEMMLGATGKTYAQLLQEKIFTPAGMKTASCQYEAMLNCTDKCLPSIWNGNGWNSTDISPAYYNAAAAGGVNASIADMGEWLKVLLGHRPDIVRPYMLDEVFQPVIKTGRERRIMPHWIGRDDAAYAMGWRVLNHGADTLIYHGGYVNGYRGEIAFDRKRDIGICVLFNDSTELGSTCITDFFDRL